MPKGNPEKIPVLLGVIALAALATAGVVYEVAKFIAFTKYAFGG